MKRCTLNLAEFLANAPSLFGDDPAQEEEVEPDIANGIHKGAIRRFGFPSGDSLSCVRWDSRFHITSTDIIRALVYRFQNIMRPVVNMKKFEEGVFSDLRSLKPGVDARLELPRSEFLELLYKHHCVRTQKKQKVFYWDSVPHDMLFRDALERDLKREAMGIEPTTKVEKSADPTSFVTIGGVELPLSVPPTLAAHTRTNVGSLAAAGASSSSRVSNVQVSSIPAVSSAFAQAALPNAAFGQSQQQQHGEQLGGTRSSNNVGGLDQNGMVSSALSLASMASSHGGGNDSGANSAYPGSNSGFTDSTDMLTFATNQHIDASASASTPSAVSAMNGAHRGSATATASEVLPAAAQGSANNANGGTGISPYGFFSTTTQPSLSEYISGKVASPTGNDGSSSNGNNHAGFESMAASVASSTSHADLRIPAGMSTVNDSWTGVDFAALHKQASELKANYEEYQPTPTPYHSPKESSTNDPELMELLTATNAILTQDNISDFSEILEQLLGANGLIQESMPTANSTGRLALDVSQEQSGSQQQQHLMMWEQQTSAATSVSMPHAMSVDSGIAAPSRNASVSGLDVSLSTDSGSGNNRAPSSVMMDSITSSPSVASLMNSKPISPNNTPESFSLRLGGSAGAVGQIGSQHGMFGGDVQDGIGSGAVGPQQSGFNPGMSIDEISEFLASNSVQAGQPPSISGSSVTSMSNNNNGNSNSNNDDNNNNNDSNSAGGSFGNQSMSAFMPAFGLSAAGSTAGASQIGSFGPFGSANFMGQPSTSDSKRMDTDADMIGASTETQDERGSVSIQQNSGAVQASSSSSDEPRSIDLVRQLWMSQKPSNGPTPRSTRFSRFHPYLKTMVRLAHRDPPTALNRVPSTTDPKVAAAAVNAMAAKFANSSSSANMGLQLGEGKIDFGTVGSNAQLNGANNGATGPQAGIPFMPSPSSSSAAMPQIGGQAADSAAAAIGSSGDMTSEAAAPANADGKGSEPKQARLKAGGGRRGSRNENECEIRRYSCTFAGCNKQFKRHEHLKRHFRTHTGERPYKCPAADCGKVFARMDNLNQHIRTHVNRKTANRRSSNIMEMGQGQQQQLMQILGKTETDLGDISSSSQIMAPGSSDANLRDLLQSLGDGSFQSGQQTAAAAAVSGNGDSSGVLYGATVGSDTAVSASAAATALVSAGTMPMVSPTRSGSRMMRIALPDGPYQQPLQSPLMETNTVSVLRKFTKQNRLRNTGGTPNGKRDGQFSPFSSDAFSALSGGLGSGNGGGGYMDLQPMGSLIDPNSSGSATGISGLPRTLSTETTTSNINTVWLASFLAQEQQQQQQQFSQPEASDQQQRNGLSSVGFPFQMDASGFGRRDPSHASLKRHLEYDDDDMTGGNSSSSSHGQHQPMSVSGDEHNSTSSVSAANSSKFVRSTIAKSQLTPV